MEVMGGQCIFQGYVLECVCVYLQLMLVCLHPYNDTTSSYVWCLDWKKKGINGEFTQRKVRGTEQFTCKDWGFDYQNVLFVIHGASR